MVSKVEIAADWLTRYTGMPLERFGDYVLLTNFRDYVQRFAEQFGCKIYGDNRPMQAASNDAGLTIVNAPGTIDSDYRGELKVLLINLGSEALSIGHGDRIAQLLIAPVTRASFVESADVSASDRGEGGFGSTGV